MGVHVVVLKANKLGGIIYKRIDPNTLEEYIGRAKSMDRFIKRQGEHRRADGVDYDFQILDNTGKVGKELQFAEESYRLVNEDRLRGNGLSLQNKIPAMNMGKFINLGNGVIRREGSRIKTRLK